MNGLKIDEAEVSAVKYEKNRKPKFNNVYVKEFPKGTTLDVEQFKALFKDFGTITSAIVTLDESEGNKGFLGFGFLCFERAEDAEKLITQGYTFNGTKLYIGKALTKEQREKEKQKKLDNYKKSLAKLNLIVTNIPEETTVETFEQFFAKFGKITSAKLETMEEGKCKGYGYVAFEKAEEATRAREEGKKELFNGKYLTINNHEPKSVRQLKKQEERDKKALQKHQIGGQSVAGGQNMDVQQVMKMLQMFFQSNPNFMNMIGQMQGRPGQQAQPRAQHNQNFRGPAPGGPHGGGMRPQGVRQGYNPRPQGQYNQRQNFRPQGGQPQRQMMQTPYGMQQPGMQQ